MTYQNCRGVKTRLETLKCNLLNSDSDIVALTETWLNGSVLTSEFCVNRLVFRKDRDYQLTGLKQGGGVLLAIKDDYEVSECDIFSDDLEALCIRIRTGVNKFLYVVVVYFAPKSSIELYNRFYECVETELLGCDCLILGDFNLREYVDNLSTKYLCSFRNFLAFTNLTQENTVKNFNDVILDFVLTSPSIQGINVDTDGDPLLPVDRHHPPLIVSFTFRKLDAECKLVPNVKFNFKKARFTDLYDMMRDQDWKPLETLDNVDAAVSYFNDVFRSIFIKCVPLSAQVGRVFPVWFSREIIKLIKLKERYYARYKRSRANYWQAKYSQVRKLAKIKIDNAYNAYLKDVQHALRADPKYFWTYIKSQKRGSDIPAEMSFNGALFTGASDISDGFAMYFKSVFCPLESKVGGFVADGSYAVNTPITREEIFKALKKLKGNRAIGPDGIPGYIIKGCSEFLVEPLLQIFNLSLRTATYPEEWRVGKVIPVFKGGSRNDIGNYRPITILNAASKVFEIVLFNRIYETVKDTISPGQHGFLPKRSTLTNLLSFTQYNQEAIQNKTQVDVIYTDMEKAFDKVRHKLIIDRLLGAGVHGDLVGLMHSYLTHRRHYVEVKGAKSASYVSASGVPQGSNLGPLLFLVAINGIGEAVKNARGLVFADDFKIFLNIADSSDCVKLQDDLDGVADWCNSNGFRLNVNKCACMSVALKRDVILYPYDITGKALKRVTTQRDLGVVFDETLSFRDHISGRIADASAAMGFVIRSTKHFNVDVCLKLFDAFVLPKLEYNCVIWSPQYDSWKWSIERLHRKFLKYMYFKRFGCYPERGHDHQTLLRMFNRMSLENRRKRYCLITLYKILKESIICPDILLQLPFAIKRADNVDTRHKKTFYLDCPRTNLYKNSPLYRMCMLYNELVCDVDFTSVGIDEFKKIVDSRLILYST